MKAPCQIQTKFGQATIKDRRNLIGSSKSFSGHPENWIVYMSDFEPLSDDPKRDLEVYADAIGATVEFADDRTVAAILEAQKLIREWHQYIFRNSKPFNIFLRVHGGEVGRLRLADEYQEGQL